MLYLFDVLDLKKKIQHADTNCVFLKEKQVVARNLLYVKYEQTP